MYYRDLIGRKIGKWTVLGADTHGTDRRTRMLCRCDCGTTRTVDAYCLQHGGTVSCGQCKTISPENGYMRCVMKNGASFIFDREDTELVKEHSWSFARGHIRTSINGKNVFLHRLIMSAPTGTEIDHINMDKTDNRRQNLRKATHAENQRNKGLRKDSTTGYKGVCLDKRTGRYFAYINANGRRTYLGSFSDRSAAAHAYDEAAVRLHMEFARTNCMKGGRNG